MVARIASMMTKCVLRPLASYTLVLKYCCMGSKPGECLSR